MSELKGYTVWQSTQSIAACKCLTVTQWHWLSDSGSLTQRLKDHFSDNITFRLLFEGKANLEADEAALLCLDINQKQWVREVAWYYQQQCWIVARVVVPVSRASSFDDILTIGERSIGDLLFRSDGIVSGEIELAQIPRKHPYYLRVNRITRLQVASLWGRRRTFSRSGGSLLVNEIFLPEFFAHASDHA